MSNPPPAPNPERGTTMAPQPPIPSEPASQGPRPTPRVLPGTALADRAEELGLESDAAPPYLVRSTRQMKAGDLARAAELASACDRFYSSGRAVGWFRAALAPLRERPSAFLCRYGAWLGRALPGHRSPAHAGIEKEQLAFLEESYRAAGLERLLPALRDLVRLHGAMSRAVAEGETAEIELSFDPDELLAAAPGSLKRFAAAATRRRNTVVVAPDAADGTAIRPKSGAGGGRGA